jgi:hypothetical protein
MKLHRLTPTSLVKSMSPYIGRCAACEQPMTGHEPIVHLYGQTFHRDCAFYRRGSEAQRAEGAA